MNFYQSLNQHAYVNWLELTEQVISVIYQSIYTTVNFYEHFRQPKSVFLFHNINITFNVMLQ